MTRSKSSIVNGFTIVELLVVIVVIAILASISVVAYGGIQGRAHDTAVQSDLRNMNTALLLYKQDKGEFPGRNGGTYNAALVLSELTSSTGVVPAKFTIDSYGTVDSVYSSRPAGTVIVGIIYSAPSGPPTDICIMAQSKSGNKFVYTTTNGTTPIGKDPVGSLGSPRDFKTVCGNEGKLPNAASLLYAGYDLHNYQ